MIREERIYAVIETLLASWEQWEAEAGQCAQQEQDPQGYRDVMFAKLYPLLEGLLRPEPAPVFATQTNPVVQPFHPDYVPLDFTGERLKLKPGDTVAVEMDTGEWRAFVVRCVPWQLCDDTWVVGLERVIGGFDLGRVRAKKVVST